jgi:CTP synthase
MIIEVGGTVGEYQNAIFLEAGRQLRLQNPKNVMFAMVSYLPTPSKLGEMKTKPTQNAVRQLNGYGINPQMIIARSEQPVDRKRKEKMANMCGVDIDSIISAPDVDSIYKVPLNFERDGLSKNILSYFGVKAKTTKLQPWEKLVHNMEHPTGEIKIAICGKYFDSGDFTLSDAYISVIEALKISAYHQKLKPVIDWVNVKDFEDGTKKLSELKKYDGVLIPGGFGKSGIEGKIQVIEYVRKNKIPYFGLCYGMQLMVIEYARNVLKLKNAHSYEVNPKAQHLIIDVMEDQKEKLKQEQYGGSMRLGVYPCKVTKGTVAFSAYKQELIQERHRHRYEVNPKYVKEIAAAGLVFSGVSPDGRLMEIAELPRDKHPFFLGVQFHPEFLARPLDPHPLFEAFIKASVLGKKK